VTVLDVAVIADDLTGAADCGIAFAAAGIASFVAVGDAPPPPSARVVALDADTRRLPADLAAARARAAAAQVYAAGARALYKKLDSTLRGHVGAELAATLAASAEGGRHARALVVFAPAFPGAGRTTRDGQVLVKGTPLAETEVWRGSGTAGPADPVAMLRLAGVHASSLRLHEVRAGPAALARALAQLAAGDVQALVCDAEEEGDLAAIAGAAARLDRPVIWAGSAGLARHLPAALGLRPDAAPASPSLAGVDGPLLVLVGSRSSVAREQARALAAEPGVARVDLDPRALLGEAGAEPAAALAAALASGQDVLAVLGETPLGLERGPALAAALGQVAAGHAARLGGAVATGGDIARAFLGAVGAAGLHLVGEVEPGVPLGVAATPRPLPLVTKAGAFGGPATLVRCRAALRALLRQGAPRSAGGG
jgi:D-threonate/D-erythronate kinase